MDQSYNEVVDRLSETNRHAVESAMRLNRMAMRTQGLLARQQLAMLEQCIEAGSRQLRVVTETRDPKEIWSRHAEIVVELGERLVAVAQESLDIQVQVRDEFSSWLEAGIETVQVPPAPRPVTPTRGPIRAKAKAKAKAKPQAGTRAKIPTRRRVAKKKIV